MPPYNATQEYPPVQPPDQEKIINHINMFGMNMPTDPVIVQLLQQMKQMVEKIAGLTLTNQTLQQDKKGSDGKQDVNLKTGLPRKGHFWTCGCCAHWVETVQKKRADIKTMLPLKLVRMAATKIGNETSGERMFMMD